MDADGNKGDEDSLKTANESTKSNANVVVAEEEESTEDGVKQSEEMKTPSGHKKEV